MRVLKEYGDEMRKRPEIASYYKTGGEMPDPAPLDLCPISREIVVRYLSMPQE